MAAAGANITAELGVRELLVQFVVRDVSKFLFRAPEDRHLVHERLATNSFRFPSDVPEIPSARNLTGSG
jgi:hypothetical protein